MLLSFVLHSLQLLILMRHVVDAGSILRLNGTEPGSQEIRSLDIAGFMGGEDIDCRGPPKGTSAIVVDGERDGFGITVSYSACVWGFTFSLHEPNIPTSSKDGGPPTTSASKALDLET